MNETDRDRLLLTMAGQIATIEERTRDLPARVRSLEDSRMKLTAFASALGAAAGYLAKYVLPVVLAFQYAHGMTTNEQLVVLRAFGPYVMGPLS